jgi:BMFP domain-containing protein YqiC
MRTRERIKIYEATIADLEKKLFEFSPFAEKIYKVIRSLEEQIKEEKNK